MAARTQETEARRGKKVSEETRAQQGALEKDCSISLTPRFSGVASGSPSFFSRFNGFLCVCRAVRNVLGRALRAHEDGTSRAEDALSGTSGPFGRDWSGRVAMWRFNQTIKIAMSAGETPDIREACPSVAGRMFASF